MSVEHEKAEAEVEKYNFASISIRDKSDDATTTVSNSSGSVQSPTISSVSNEEGVNSDATSRSIRKRGRPSSSSSTGNDCNRRMGEELEAALERIAELESIIRLKDERIKLLEEEHERHLMHGHMLASPDIHDRPKRGRKQKRRIIPKPQIYIPTTSTAPPRDMNPLRPERVLPDRPDGEFEMIRASIMRSHKKSRPFDLIDEPPPRHTIIISDGIFTTPHNFYRNVYAPYEEPVPHTLPNLPKWREVFEEDEEECAIDDNDEEEPEDLSDEAFEKRHTKHEAEERRSIKKDKSYQREQFYNSRLKRSAESPSKFTTYFPSTSRITAIEVTEQLPVSLWGHTLPNIKPSTFTLPWLTTTDQLKYKS